MALFDNDNVMAGTRSTLTSDNMIVIVMELSCRYSVSFKLLPVIICV